MLGSSLPVNVSSDITLSPCKQHFKIDIHETRILNCTQTEVGAHKENDKHLSIWTIPCIMLFNITDNVYQITSKIVKKKKEKKRNLVRYSPPDNDILFLSCSNVTASAT